MICGACGRACSCPSAMTARVSVLPANGGAPAPLIIRLDNTGAAPPTVQLLPDPAVGQ